MEPFATRSKAVSTSPIRINLANNENPFGPSPHAIEAAQRSLVEVHRYPDAYGIELAEALSKAIGLPAEQFAMGNGSDELIHHLGLTLLHSPEDVVVVGTPSFVRYDATAHLSNATLKRIPLDAEGRFDLTSMANAVTEQTKIVFLAVPNNPTGTIIENHQLRTFLDQLPKRTLVAVDEAYYEYARWNSRLPRADQLVREGYPVIGLRTFSKAYGLAGLRVGYAFGPKELVDSIHKVRSPFNLNHIAQAAALAALHDEEHLNKVVASTKSSVATIFDFARQHGLHAFPSHANFVYIDVGRDAAEVCESLFAMGIAIRKIGATTVRVTAGTDDETAQFLTAFRQVL